MFYQTTFPATFIFIVSIVQPITVLGRADTLLSFIEWMMTLVEDTVISEEVRQG